MAQYPKVLRMYQGGATTSQIAAEFGVSQNSVWSMLVRRGDYRPPTFAYVHEMYRHLLLLAFGAELRPAAQTNRDYLRTFDSRHPGRRRALHEDWRRSLSDGYVKYVLMGCASSKGRHIPEELIAAKRAHLILQRSLKEYAK